MGVSKGCLKKEFTARPKTDFQIYPVWRRKNWYFQIIFGPIASRTIITGEGWKKVPRGFKHVVQTPKRVEKIKRRGIGKRLNMFSDQFIPNVQGNKFDTKRAFLCGKLPIVVGVIEANRAKKTLFQKNLTYF